MSPTREGSLVTAGARDRIRGRAEPIGRAVGRLGITPNGLTVIGFLISVLAAVLAGLQWWLVAGIVSVLGALFDMLDGALARATGRTSRFGAFLDSSLDRWGEGVVYAGVAAGAVLAGERVTAVLASLALSSAFMVSYTRAKAESLGFRGEVGIAPRPERIAIMAAGLILAGVTGGPQLTPWLQAALAALFVLSTITTIQRVAHVRRQASETEAND